MTRRPALLLVEDEAKIGQPISEHLEAIGHAVDWVRSVREARTRITETSPDLMVLDTSLETDGLEFFQAIRFAPEHPAAGVVILTEPGDHRRHELAQQLGAAAVVDKPVDPEQLAAVVADLLSCL
jgi:two-component system phosphate regulon response regulator PhoB